MSQPLPMFNIRELMDAGVHFGHKTMRWNPKMAPYLHGIRNDIHIIDLQQTVPMLYRALKAVQDVAARNGRILFVGTKRQASELITDAAKRSGQYYVNQRWLGGMLTNWNTVSNSIKTLKKLDEQLSQSNVTVAEDGEETINSVYTKKELLQMTRERDKLERSLGGIKDMPKQPDLIFVIDTNKEELALQEAAKLGIPVVAIVDSNSNPDGIAYPVPGNDDATRAIALYCQLISDAVLSGISESLNASGVDLGESADLPEAANDSEPTSGKERALNKGKARVSKNAVASEAEVAATDRKNRSKTANKKVTDVVVEKKAARKTTTKE